MPDVMFYVYIIKSVVHQITYKGITQNPEKRLSGHNANLSRYTAHKGPWSLIYLKGFATKTAAIIEEKRIKKLNKLSIDKLVNSSENIIK